MIDDELNRKIMQAEDMEEHYKEEVWCLNFENKQLRERIDKAIKHLELFIGEPQLSKYDTLKILTYTRDILKGSDSNDR